MEKLGKVYGIKAFSSDTPPEIVKKELMLSILKKTEQYIFINS